MARQVWLGKELRHILLALRTAKIPPEEPLEEITAEQDLYLRGCQAAVQRLLEAFGVTNAQLTIDAAPLLRTWNQSTISNITRAIVLSFQNGRELPARGRDREFFARGFFAMIRSIGEALELDLDESEPSTQGRPPSQRELPSPRRWRL